MIMEHVSGWKVSTDSEKVGADSVSCTISRTKIDCVEKTEQYGNNLMEMNRKHNKQRLHIRIIGLILEIHLSQTVNHLSPVVSSYLCE